MEASVLERERDSKLKLKSCLYKRVEEIPELEVNLHEALQETEQLKVQMNELRAKQREGEMQQELKSMKQE